VEPSWILLGCGTTELLRNLPHAFALPDGEVVTARESYRELPLESQRLGLKTHLVPLDRRLVQDLEAMARLVNEKTRIVNITNPNNPTGTVLSREAVAGLAGKLPVEVVLCVDEAYIEFAPEVDSSGLVRKHRNVLVLRTFSKTQGLAGMRIGYALGHPDLLEPLRRCALRYSINTAGYAGALAALEDSDHLRRTLRLRDQARVYYYQQELAALGLAARVGVTPFVLAEVGRDSLAVVQDLLARGVYVRPGRDWDLPTWIRISYGTMAQNRVVLGALKQVLKT